MADRFYVPGNWSQVVEIEGTEAHHLSRVLRAEPGETIEIFDGQGRSCTAVIESVRKQVVTARLSSSIVESRLPDCEIVLAVAVPKGDRFSWLIEKATELGVDRLIPLLTTRSVVKPSDQKLLKGEQTVIAACKQSRRDRLLQIEELCPLVELNQRMDLKETKILVGDAGAGRGSAESAKIEYKLCRVVAAVGPEGGFTSEEMTLLQDWKAVPVSLSPNVLRVETAALAFAVWLANGRMLSDSADS